MKLRKFPVSLPPGLGSGAMLALGLLLGLNLMLLSDHVVHRYSAVFAVGRAMDKQLFVESRPPTVLLLGNSRVDNGIDPSALSREWTDGTTAFNLGVPGANARVMYGMLKRMDDAGALTRVRAVLIGLDESFVQPDDSLGYIYFFGHRPTLFAEAEYRLWLGSWYRLWSYADNLRQVREPGKALRFARATFQQIEPVGGAAWRYQGYRKGFGSGGQDEAQASRQEAMARVQPDKAMLKSLDQMIDLLQQRRIKIAVAYPPLQNRKSAYVDSTQSNGAYARINSALKERDVKVLDEQDPVPRQAAFFVNAGHLNDEGAQIYSSWLAKILHDEWRRPVMGK